MLNKITPLVEKHSKKFEITVGLVTALSSLSGLIGKFFNIQVGLLIACIGIFLLMRWRVRRLSTDLSDLTNGKKLGLRTRLLSGLSYLALIPIPFLIYHLIAPNPPCDTISEEPYLALTKFSDSKSDDFSYALISDLNMIQAQGKSFEMAFIDTFLNQKVSSQLDQLENLVHSQCHNRGLLVFGKRSVESELFDCTVYISKNLQSAFIEQNLSNQKLVRLRNPADIQFSIDKQTEIVSQFLLLLLDYYKGNFEETIIRIEQLRKLPIWNQSSEVKTFCQIYEANSYLGKNEIDKARTIYSEALTNSLDNALVHHNYAQLELVLGDSSVAFQHFEIAHSLNPGFMNLIPTYSMPNNEAGEQREPTLPQGIPSAPHESVALTSGTDSLKSVDTPIITVTENSKESDSEKKRMKSTFPEHCRIVQLAANKYAVYDLQEKKIGEYQQIWSAAGRHRDEKGNDPFRNFYYVRRDEYYGVIDNYGKIILRPGFNSLEEVNFFLSHYNK
jgi:tetratricopeptide (TPR) repeat protein